MYKLFLKRILDIVISILALFFLIPLFIPVMLILLFTGENEIFYFQKRIGFNNKFFTIWKFATMLKNSENLNTGSLTVRNDPRILPFGQFLRFSKINELPQIFNVIIGNMSIVGPRPQMEVDFLKYSNKVQEKIYTNKPGITGIGSILFRDEERWISDYKGDKHEFYKKNIAPYKGKVEMWYNDNVSLLIDLKIIILTIYCIIANNNKMVFKIFKSLPSQPDYFKK